MLTEEGITGSRIKMHWMTMAVVVMMMMMMMMMMMIPIVERVFCPGGRELSDSDKDSAENGEEEERRG